MGKKDWNLNATGMGWEKDSNGTVKGMRTRREWDRNRMGTGQE